MNAPKINVKVGLLALAAFGAYGCISPNQADDAMPAMCRAGTQPVLVSHENGFIKNGSIKSALADAAGSNPYANIKINLPSGHTLTGEAQEHHGVGILDGDIIVWDRIHPHTPNPQNLTRKGIAQQKSAQLWPDGIIPYVMHPSVDDTSQTAQADMRARIICAAAQWETSTPLRFVPRRNEADYLIFRTDRGKGICRSWLGRQGGAQDVELSSVCSYGNIAHELGHVLGLMHEHARPDRDTHIQIVWDAIEGSAKPFAMMAKNHPDVQAMGPYDLDSIMHYGPYAFAKGSLATIIARSGRKDFGQRTQISLGDLKTVYALYRPSFELPEQPIPDEEIFDLVGTLPGMQPLSPQERGEDPQNL